MNLTDIKIKVFIITFLLGFAVPSPALEVLSNNEMQIVTGQAGLSILVTSLLITHKDSVIIDDLNGGTLGFQNRNLSMTFSTPQPILLDMVQDKTSYIFRDYYNNGTQYFEYNTPGPLYGHTIISFTADSLSDNFDASIGNIQFNGKNIGNADLVNFQVASAGLDIFQYDGTGIDAALRAQFQISKLEYTFDTESSIDPKTSLKLSGIMGAGSFTGDSLPSYDDTVSTGASIDTSTWVPNGNFKIGDTEAVLPFDDPNSLDLTPMPYLRSLSLDLKKDNSSFIRQKFNISWNGDYNLDPDGYIGDGSASQPYLTNPRYNKIFIEAGVPLDGSIRIQEMNYGTDSYGPSAIDGIKGMVKIEAPGYGIGNNPIPPYYH